MNRYPEKQALQDGADQEEHGRVAVIRPGARLSVRGFNASGYRNAVLGVAVLTRVVKDKWEAALVPTREYGRRWFHTRPGEPFTVVEELS